MKRRNRTVIGCGAVMALLVLAIGLLGYAMFGSHRYYAKNVPKHEFAPASATSIDVYELQNISGLVSVSYVVSEADFRKFAAEKGWELSTRSGWMMLRSPGSYLGEDVPSRELESYLFYEKVRTGGAGISVVYVPSESRAYVNKSNR